MRTIRRIWSALNHVSTASWLWGLGGAAVATFIAGYFTAVVTDVPQPWQTVGVLGFSLLVFMTITTTIPMLPSGKTNSRPVSSLVEAIAPVPAMPMTVATPAESLSARASLEVTVVTHSLGVPSWDVLRSGLTRGLEPAWIESSKSPSVVTITVHSKLATPLRQAEIELRLVPTAASTGRFIGVFRRVQDGLVSTKFDALPIPDHYEEGNRRVLKEQLPELLPEETMQLQVLMYVSGRPGALEMKWFVTDKGVDVGFGKTTI